MTMSASSSRCTSIDRSGRQHVRRPVEVALEAHPLLAHLGQLGEAHHLIAAAVGQDRPVPAHEAVQPAEPRDPLGAGPQHQMIGVAEDDVGARRAHVVGLHRLDRRRGPDRHERRRADLPALHGDRAGPRGAVGGGDGEGEAGHRRPLLPSCRAKSSAASLDFARTNGYGHMIEPWIYPALTAVAVLTGFIDAIAGGGGLIMMPALAVRRRPAAARARHQQASVDVRHAARRCAITGARAWSNGAATACRCVLVFAGACGGLHRRPARSRHELLAT